MLSLLSRIIVLVEVVSQQSELCIFRVRSSDGCAPFLLLGGTSGRAQKLLEKKGKNYEKEDFNGDIGNFDICCHGCGG